MEIYLLSFPRILDDTVESPGCGQSMSIEIIYRAPYLRTTYPSYRAKV